MSTPSKAIPTPAAHASIDRHDAPKIADIVDHRIREHWGDEGGNPGPSAAPSPRRAPEEKLRVLTGEEQVERLMGEGGGQAHY